MKRIALLSIVPVLFATGLLLDDVAIAQKPKRSIKGHSRPKRVRSLKKRGTIDPNRLLKEKAGIEISERSRSKVKGASKKRKVKSRKLRKGELSPPTSRKSLKRGRLDAKSRRLKKDKLSR